MDILLRLVYDLSVLTGVRSTRDCQMLARYVWHIGLKAIGETPKLSLDSLGRA